MKNLSILSLKKFDRSTHVAMLLLLIVTVIATTTGVSAQTASKEPAATRGRSIVRGRVVTHDTNRPLRRVAVSLYDSGNRGAGQHRETWTDRRGEFVIKNVPAGKYYVLVDAPGIIRSELYGGAAAMADPDATVVSVDGTSSAEVRVRAKRGGAITGRVTYADGEPALSTEITLLRRKDGQLIHIYQGNQQQYGNGSATNERGDYRLSGLPPGEYVVGAGERKLNATGQPDEDGSYRISSGTVGFTYYGGTTSARAATTIQIDASEEADDIDITLVERGAHLLSGVVVSRGDGRPVPRAEVHLRIKEEPASGGGPSLEGHQVFADAQGRWEISEVADGSYTLLVTPYQNYRSYDRPTGSGGGERAVPKFVAKRQNLIVAGGDQSGLVIEVSAGGRVSGIIAMDGGTPLPRRVFVHPEAAEGSSGGESFNQPPAEIQPDGTFVLEGLPASWLYLNVSADNRQGYYIKSAIGNGVDLLRSPLQLADGGEVKDVRVVLSANVATFMGRILATDGTPARGAFVMLMPTDPDLQRRRGARLHGQANAEGLFTVAGAPGEYAALVVRPDGRRLPLKADELKERLANAPRVTLQPGENKRLDLTVPGDK